MIINRYYKWEAVQFLFDFSEYNVEQPKLKDVVSDMKKCYKFMDDQEDFLWDLMRDRHQIVCDMLHDKYYKIWSKLKITYNMDELAMAFIKVDEKWKVTILDSMYVVE